MKNIFKLPLAVLIALSCMVGPAYAGGSDLTTPILETADSRKACTDPLIENPFTQFGDNLDYVLAPDGNFDGSVAGWQFAGGAKVVEPTRAARCRCPRTPRRFPRRCASTCTSRRSACTTRPSRT